MKLLFLFNLEYSCLYSKDNIISVKIKTFQNSGQDKFSSGLTGSFVKT